MERPWNTPPGVYVYLLLPYSMALARPDCDCVHDESIDLTLDALVSEDGLTATLTVTGALPDERIALVRGARRGLDPCPAILGGVCLEVGEFKLLEISRADDDGNVEFVVSLPQRAAGDTWSFQAAGIACDIPALSPITEVEIPVIEEPELPVCAYGADSWGEACEEGGAACVRDDWWDVVYPDGLWIGPAHFDSPGSIEDYLPGSDRGNSELYGQILTLQLNLDFGAAGAFGHTTPLEDEAITEGPYSGYTARMLLEHALVSESCPDLIDALRYFNEDFEDNCEEAAFPEPPPCGDDGHDDDEEEEEEDTGGEGPPDDTGTEGPPDDTGTEGPPEDTATEDPPDDTGAGDPEDSGASDGGGGGGGGPTGDTAVHTGDTAVHTGDTAEDSGIDWNPGPLCGNGVRDPGEECDDGNMIALDGCNPGCVFHFCGDGELQCHEECDDGNNEDGDGCAARCFFEVPPEDTSASTGDTGAPDSGDVETGILDTGLSDTGLSDGIGGGGGDETGEDTSETGGTGDTGAGGSGSPGDSGGGGGGGAPGDSGEETGAGTGDTGAGTGDTGAGGEDTASGGDSAQDTGDLGGGETADTGDLGGGTGDTGTTAPTCGNGEVDLEEECDDANTVEGDGCSNDCDLEACGPGVARYDETRPVAPVTMALVPEEGDEPSISVSGADPGAIVWFLGGRNRDYESCPWFLIDTCVNLHNPETLGWAVADGAGVATLSPIPDAMQGGRWFLQAAVIGSDAALSDVVGVVMARDGLSMSVCETPECGLPIEEIPPLSGAVCSDDGKVTKSPMDCYGNLPGIGGGDTEIGADDGEPGDTVWFIGSPDPSDGPCPLRGYGTKVGLRAPIVLGSAVFDENGHATLYISEDAQYVPGEGDLVQGIVTDGIDSYSCPPIRLTTRCGDGVVHEGEQCDDGNRARGDGCSAQCTSEHCGDGVIDAQYGETCDDHNKRNDDGCSDRCKVEGCGDGDLQVRDGEQCDDGDNNGGDGCSADCRIEVCGDGIKEPSEDCDDGGRVEEDGCDAYCRVEFCGDGVVQEPAGENCDDFNNIDGDGCPADCQRPVCGNSAVEEGETCDDGNTDLYDGCSDTCQIEDCGDLIIQEGEECDGGAGCDYTCSNTFVAVSTGAFHGCGLDPDGEVYCWGEDSSGQLTVPAGPFTSIHAGHYHTCALRADGSAACWGRNTSGQLNVPAGVTFQSIAAGGYHTCGLSTAGSVTCWGLDSWGQAQAPSGVYASISAGAWHTCALDASGSATCWGRNDLGQASPPATPFSQIAVGTMHTCALSTSGQASCWGSNLSGRSNAPAGTFTDIVAGYTHSCALTTSGQASCWGNSNKDVLVVPSTSLEDIDARSQFTCGLKDHDILCWGANERGQSTPRVIGGEEIVP